MKPEEQSLILIKFATQNHRNQTLRLVSKPRFQELNCFLSPLKLTPPATMFLEDKRIYPPISFLLG
jgi:hypothetical protein